MVDLKEILDYIEKNVDIEQKEKSKKNIIKALDYENHTPIITTSNATPKFKSLPYKETFNDMSAMLYNQLVPIANNIGTNDDLIYSIRANYGVGTLPSLFGAESILSSDTDMPWCKHLSKEQIERCIDKQIPDLYTGLGQKVLETYEYYMEVLEKYPSANKAIALYHEDLQGPFDVAHLLYGSEIYFEFYDDEEFVHQLLSLTTDTYIAFMKKSLALIGNEFDGYCYHWNTIFKGNVVLRNDSAVSLSPDMYNNFLKPYDDKIAGVFNSAGMHYCGQNEAWMPDMLQTADIKSLNFGFVPGKEYGIEFLKIAKNLASSRKIPIISYNMTKEDMNKIKDTDLIQGVTFVVY